MLKTKIKSLILGSTTALLLAGGMTSAQAVAGRSVTLPSDIYYKCFTESQYTPGQPFKEKWMTQRTAMIGTPYEKMWACAMMLPRYSAIELEILEEHKAYAISMGRIRPDSQIDYYNKGLYIYSGYEYVRGLKPLPDFLLK